MKNVIRVVFLILVICSPVYAQSNAEQAKRIEDFTMNDKSDWAIRYFVDDWGDITNKPYITTLHYITGTFSNSATTDSVARLEPIFSLPNNFNFEIYEYNWGSSPYQPFTFNDNAERYRVQLEDSAGARFTVYASISTTRFSFDSSDRDTVLNCFLKGGRVRMLLNEIGSGRRSYRFSFSDTNGFVAAYYALTGKKTIN
jgi:hypothetical protein